MPYALREHQVMMIRQAAGHFMLWNLDDEGGLGRSVSGLEAGRRVGFCMH